MTAKVERGEHARDEGEAQREAAAVGEEVDRRRLVNCERGHGEGSHARGKRYALQPDGSEEPAGIDRGAVVCPST